MAQNLGRVAAVYCFTAGAFLIIDLLWLGVAARGLYGRYLGALLSTQVNWVAALLFYLVYIGGIVLFVLIPSIEKKRSVFETSIFGALLGLFAYGTFDLTCLALLRGWSVVVTIVDIAWGTLLTGTTAAMALGFYRKMFRAN